MIFTGTQAVMADPGIDVVFPNNANKKIGVGGTIQAEVGVQTPEANNLISTRIAHALDTDGNIVFPGTTALCTAQAAAGFGGADEQSLLVDAANLAAISPVSVVYPGGTGIIQSITLNVGPTGAADIVASTKGAPVFYEADTPADGVDGNRLFVGVVGAIAGATGIPNAVIGVGNFVINCGCIDNNNNQICDGGEPVSNDQDSYEVATPVGGEIIHVSTTALLLGGITSSPFWILSALIIGAGAGFALLNFQLDRKNQ